MKKRKAALGIAGVLAIAAWMTQSVSPFSAFVLPVRSVIKTTAGEDGSQQTWELLSGNKDMVPTLLLKESTITQVAQLGIRCAKLPPTAPPGEGASVGVAIAEVLPDSPAEQAGLTKGDILLQIDGTDLERTSSLRNYLRTVTDPTQEVELTVVPQSGTSATGSSPGAKRLKLLPDQVDFTETSTDLITLRHSPGIQHYTGLQAATLPAEHAKRLYDIEQPTLLVTGVVCGSQAYYAGLRVGDRILTVNGGPATLDELRVAVFFRVKEEWDQPPFYDLLEFDDEHFPVPGDSYVLPPTAVPFVLVANDQPTNEEAQIVLEVDGPLGPHRTDLPLATENIDQVRETRLYGILTGQSTVRGTTLEFFDPGFTLGFDYRSYATESTTREPVHILNLELLPFGMFQVRKFPNDGIDEVTLFWFLTF
ncbi:MAG: PDZ domain-containing protein [Planctomycetota bacterium]|nr:PDZ domain-containing protein [Planctomycetota bacterium]